MNLKKSMIIGIISLCILSAIVLSIMIVLLNDGNKKVLNEDFKNYESTNYKNQLKNYVNMAFSVIKKHYYQALKKEELEEVYGKQMKQAMDMAYGVAENNYKMYKQGKITEEEAKNNVISNIKKMRYNKGEGYIWINDTGRKYPKMIMHPTMPELDGRVLDDPKYNCANGEKKENLFIAAIKVCEENGHGFIDYLWPKPLEDGVTEEYKQKLSYVKLFDEWNWILGTGVYVESAMDEAKKDAIAELRDLRYNDGVGYFWINDTKKPFPKMIMHPTIPDLDGNILDKPEYYCAGKEKKNLFVAFNDICKKKGSGYVEYLWPKPIAKGVTEENVPKISYVKLFKEWNWIVGSGMYTDDIEKAIAKQEKNMSDNNVRFVITIIIVISIIITLAVFLGYLFLSKKILKPVSEIVEYLNEMAKGNLTIECEVNKGDIGEFRLIKEHIQNSVDELSSLISNIHQEAAGVYHASNETKKHIETLKTNLDDITTTTEELSSCVEETAATTEEMYSISDDLEITTKNVFGNIKNKNINSNNIMSYITSSTEKLMESISTMSKGISELATANGQNAVGTNEIARSVSDISVEAEKVANQADTLKKTAFKLMESVGVFSTKENGNGDI
jgi:methyl-accepting chemotaxis protein